VETGIARWPTPYTGPPATIGTTLAAGLVLSGGCQACRRRIEIGEAALLALGRRYGDDVALPDVMERVICAARVAAKLTFGCTCRGWKGSAR